MDDDDKYWPTWEHPIRTQENRQLSYIPNSQKPLERERDAFVEAVRGHRDPQQYELKFSEGGIPQ